MHCVVKARNLAHMYIIPKQLNLAIVPSQITHAAVVAAIFQNGHSLRNKEVQNLQFLLYNLYRFCEAKISEKVLANVPHHSIRNCVSHFTKWRPFPK